MTPPKVTFNREETTATLSGFGAGWTLRQIGTIHLFQEAQLQFPTSWSRFKIGATTHIIDTNWRLNGSLMIQQTLEAGASYSLADGASGSLQLDTELVQRILDRPLVRLDATFRFRLEGTADRDGFDGSGSAFIFLRAKF